MHQIREDKARIREIELLKWEHDSGGGTGGRKKEREGEREEHLHRLEKGR